MKTVGIIFHPRITAGTQLAEDLCNYLETVDVRAWRWSAWDEAGLKEHAPGTDLAISVGGDGTILRVSRVMSMWNVPIVGINLGHLGFMTELLPEDVMEKLPGILSGQSWTDDRTMLQVEKLSEGEDSAGLPGQPLFALNDAVIGRGGVARLVRVDARIDGEYVSSYKVDGLIVATATGSTGYSLAAGGPILHPQSDDLLLNPISPHLTMPYPLVLPAETVIDLTIHTSHQAMISIDGQVEFALRDGDRIRVRRSSHVARFLRVYGRWSFYTELERRLRLRNI